MKLPAIKITAKILKIITSVFIFELLLLIFIVYRQEKVIGNLKGEIRKRKGELENYSAVYNRIPQLEETLNSMRAQLKGIEWELPSSAYVPTFLQELENWAKECNVKLTNLSPQQAPTSPPPNKEAPEETAKRGALKGEAKSQQTTKPKPYETISFNIQVEGNYYAINKFLDGFRRFPKAISLSKLDINPQQTEGGAPILRVSISLDMAVLAGERK